MSQVNKGGNIKRNKEGKVDEVKLKYVEWRKINQGVQKFAEGEYKLVKVSEVDSSKGMTMDVGL